MRHLRIEQSNIQENVDRNVVTKLYELAQSNLDSTSNLQGIIRVTATYQEYIDTIVAKYPDLTIISDNIYIRFADPEVERLLKNSVGDGTGVTLAQAAAATLQQIQVFQNNTTITQFDELRFFTGIATTPAFIGCENLEHIQIPNTIRSINEYSFRNCKKLVSAGDLSNLTTLNMWQSYNMNSFKVNPEQLSNLVGELNLSQNSPVVDEGESFILNAPGVTKVFFSHFAGDSITINSPITTFQCGFASNLTTLNIPSSVTDLYLVDCVNLVNFDYESHLANLTRIADRAFRKTRISRVEWPSIITTVGTEVFGSCPDLTYIHIPSTVTKINDSAFSGGNFNKRVKIDEGVTTIGGGAFYAKRIIYPSTVTQMGNQPHYSRDFVVMKSTTPPSYSTECFTGHSDQQYPIYVPDASVDAYKAQIGASTDTSTHIGWTDRVKPISQFATDFPGISLDGTGWPD